MGRECSTNGEEMKCTWILVGKQDGNRPVSRQRRRWMDNIKMELRGIGWGGIDWIDLAQDGGQWRAVLNIFAFHKLLGS
jgi:hypothetical protein